MASAIALFVYNRPWHTQQTIEALQKNKLARESDLIIFADGHKGEMDLENVTKVRTYIRAVHGFKSVTIIESSSNNGLAESIIQGVTEVLNQTESVIVLEDDMVTSPYFLSFMNQGLTLYAKEERVISIHGYIYPVKGELPTSFFLRGAHCWGWATWRRGWALFEKNGQNLLDELLTKKLDREFDYDGSYPFTKMLRMQIQGLNNSWAIRWHASAFLKNKLTLYPGISLVRNIGFDGSGVHSSKNDIVYDTIPSPSEIMLSRIPIEETSGVRKIFVTFFRSIKLPLYKRVIRKIKHIIGRIE